MRGFSPQHVVRLLRQSAPTANRESTLLGSLARLGDEAFELEQDEMATRRTGPKARNRRRQSRGKELTRTRSVTARLFSVNGTLQSLYESAGASDARSASYTPVDVGQPLVVQYLRFFLRHKPESGRNEVMISTFVKAAEARVAAAEAVNYFDPAARFDDDRLNLSHFGGENYGHPLIYYTKSYLGESLYLTTKIMEIDRIDQDVVKAIQGGLAFASSLPTFTSFLPYAAGASVGTRVIADLVNFLDRDDEIVEGHDLDLRFGVPNTPRMQSGRIVCVQEREEKEILGRFELSVANKLVEIGSNREYQDTSYFVIQVDSKTHRKFASFDHYLGAAELLEKTNRRGGARELVASLTEVLEGHNDLSAIREIEDLSADRDDPAVRKRIKALHRAMSSNTRTLYEERVKALTVPN